MMTASRIGNLIIIGASILLVLGLLQPAFGIHCFVCEDPKDYKCVKQVPFNCSITNPSITMCSTSGKKDDVGKLIKTWKGCGGDGLHNTCLKKADGVTECFCNLDLCNGFTPEFEGTQKNKLLSVIAVAFILGVPLVVGLVLRSRARITRKLQHDPVFVISQN